MKKLTILFSILIASISAFAAATTVSQITLSSASQGDKVLQIVVDNPFSDAYDNGYDAVIGANQPGGLYIYSGSERYSFWATNALGNNLPMGFGAVGDTEYTLSFQYFSGESYTIYDKKKNETITVNASTPNYVFTIDGSLANTAINDRFVINYVAPVTGYNVTLNGAGLASFSADGDDATIPDGVEAYTATYQAATQEIVLNKITATAIPAGVGVILYGTPDAAVTLPYATGADALTAENDLYPATAWAGADKNNVFVLSGNQMFKYVGTDPVPANKAFMKLPGGANNAPARISMRFNTTTAVENVETEAVQPVKFIENGEIFIRRGNEVYNLQGQLVK